MRKLMAIDAPKTTRIVAQAILAQALVRSDFPQPLAVLLDAIWIQVADADGDQCRVDAARRGGRV